MDAITRAKEAAAADLVPPPASRRCNVDIHLTTFAPRILPDAPLSHPDRWMVLSGPTPVQAVRKLAERLDRTPAQLTFRLAALCEVEVLDAQQMRAAAAKGQAGDVLAIITDGLACAQAEEAREAAIRGALL